MNEDIHNHLLFASARNVRILCVGERDKKGVATATPFNLRQSSDSADRFDDSAPIRALVLT